MTTKAKSRTTHLLSKIFTLFALIGSTICYAQAAETTDSHQAIGIEWQNNEHFVAPYIVVQLSQAGDTLMHISTSSSSTFAVPTDEVSKVIITDKNGNTQEVGIPAAESAWRLVVIILLLACMLMVSIWAYIRLQKHRFAEKQKEIETAHIRNTQHYEFATVLFADIQGFTKIAAHMNPEQLVDELDRYFIFFDELVDKYGVEKIKTIGDAYMCAGGVPEHDSANPIEVVLVGLQMIEYVQERRQSGTGFWNIRVGINTGPVISGQLGNIKKVFDIWGDSVNTASRMESSGEAGRVNISETTYIKIQDYFDCEYRGKMPVKYKGEVDMYFVNRLKEEYCMPGSTTEPNAKLMRKLQILKVTDLEERVRQNVLRGTHPNITLRMDRFLSRIRTLANMEGVSDDEHIICSVSAIFCFVQSEFPHNKLTHGKHSMNDLMRKMHLSAEQMDNVNRVISHTSQNRQPEGRVEEILQDAADEVYGRKDIVPLLLSNYDDAVSRGLTITRGEWLNKCRHHLTEFYFHTESAKKLCEVGKQKQMEILDAVMTI